MSKVFNLAFTRGINRDCHSKVFESLCEKIQLPLKSGLISATELARTDRMDLGLMQIRFLEPAMDSEKQKVISLLELTKMADDYKESHEWVKITKEFYEEESSPGHSFQIRLVDTENGLFSSDMNQIITQAVQNANQKAAAASNNIQKYGAYHP